MLTDPIADMLTRIRNAAMVVKPEVSMPASKMRVGIAKILSEEGYLMGYSEGGDDKHPELTIQIKYNADRVPVIKGLRRVSTPGGRVYRSAKELPRVQGGLGVAIVSTSKGLMVDREARREGVGGEILCEVW